MTILYICCSPQEKYLVPSFVVSVGAFLIYNIMDAKELRIGSYVTDGIYIGYISVFNNESCVIKHKSGIARSKIHLLEPIPLTEEWLLKFGFERDSNGYRLEDLYNLSFTEKFMPCFNDRPISKEHLQYVHQLQNLYFALCGKELTLIK